MHFFNLAVATVSFATLSTLAQAKDLGFRYRSPSFYVFGCFDANGKEGLNPDHIGECGDLKHADLSGRDLRGADLQHADLGFANFAGADLRGAQLGGARVFATNFAQANFAGTDLRNLYITSEGPDYAPRRGTTSFAYANFSGADFRDAVLCGIDFTGADLAGSDLRQVNFCSYSAPDVSNLAAARSLAGALFTGHPDGQYESGDTLMPLSFDEALGRGMIAKNSGE